MKLRTAINKYVAGNRYMILSDDLKSIEAWSFQWWKFVATDSVGNVYFNNTSYSSSTSTHQSDCRYILKRLGIKVDVLINNTLTHFGEGIDTVIDASIKEHQQSVKDLIQAIRKKGSWKRTNIKRRGEIRDHWFQIKDLRRIRDQYLDKAPVPHKQKSLMELRVCPYDGDIDKSRVESIQSFEAKYFTKPNGKVDIQGLKRLFNITTPDKDAPEIDRIKELLGFKSYHDITPLLVYRFTNDLNGMLPDRDSAEYLRLLKQIKRLKIEPDSLTTLELDKIHTLLIDAEKRRHYQPKEPVAFPVHPRLLSLESKVKELRVIKTDKDLRCEGRKQSHCIGSKSYQERCRAGYQAVHFKGYTFFLSPDCELIETHGRHNQRTPENVKQKFIELIEAA